MLFLSVLVFVLALRNEVIVAQWLEVLASADEKGGQMARDFRCAWKRGVGKRINEARTSEFEAKGWCVTAPCCISHGGIALTFANVPPLGVVATCDCKPSPKGCYHDKDTHKTYCCDAIGRSCLLNPGRCSDTSPYIPNGFAMKYKLGQYSNGVVNCGGAGAHKENLLRRSFDDFPQLPCTPVTPGPTSSPTLSPTLFPCASPTSSPTSPTAAPTLSPTRAPTTSPTLYPTPNPTASPTSSPSTAPTQYPTPNPTRSPTIAPTQYPTPNPTRSPTTSPTLYPTSNPTSSPTSSPTAAPTEYPTPNPTSSPTQCPTPNPTTSPAQYPTPNPTRSPTMAPTSPTASPTASPTRAPTAAPTAPTASPTKSPSQSPTQYLTPNPTRSPTAAPTSPTASPTMAPTQHPTASPTLLPTGSPTAAPTSPTASPTMAPSKYPTASPTLSPTGSPLACNTTQITLLTGTVWPAMRGSSSTDIDRCDVTLSNKPCFECNGDVHAIYTRDNVALDGTVPTKLADFPGLVTVDFGRSSLTGTFPGPLSSTLRELKLHYNFFSGSPWNAPTTDLTTCSLYQKCLLCDQDYVPNTLCGLDDQAGLQHLNEFNPCNSYDYWLGTGC